MTRWLAIFGFIAAGLLLGDLLFGAAIAILDLPPNQCWGLVTSLGYWVLK